MSHRRPPLVISVTESSVTLRPNRYELCPFPDPYHQPTLSTSSDRAVQSATNRACFAQKLRRGLEDSNTGYSTARRAVVLTR
jgi:hypothetical protein